jgi:hypothetical protein
MSKTASYVKDRYNSKTYDRYTFYIRKDETLNDALQESIQSQSVGQIAKDALIMFFGEKAEPHVNTRPKTKKPQPNYTTKRQRRAAMKRIMEQLQLIRTAEEQSRDNIPDNFQNSSTYEKAEECINALDEAIELLESAY